MGTNTLVFKKPKTPNNISKFPIATKAFEPVVKPPATIRVPITIKTNV